MISNLKLIFQYYDVTSIISNPENLDNFSYISRWWRSSCNIWPIKPQQLVFSVLLIDVITNPSMIYKPESLAALTFSVLLLCYDAPSILSDSESLSNSFFSHIFICYEDSSTISNPETRSNSSFQSYFAIIRQSLYGIETKKPCSAHLFILIIPNWESLSNSFS